MIPLSHTHCAHTSEFLGHAIRVAEFYGFVHLNSLPRGTSRTRIDRIQTQSLLFLRREERALVPLVHTCAQRGFGAKSDPVFFWRQGNAVKQGGTHYTTLELHIVGAPGAIAEAILIAVAHALADEAGIKERVVGINSIGADDSSARYMRELGSYLRKYADMIPPALMQGITDDPLSVLMQLAEKKHPLVERAPQSMEYLNEDERRHLWAVLEYLEAAHVYYELNPLVLGSRDCWNHTLFEVHAIDPDTQTLVPFIRGGRYDALVRRSQNAGTCAVGMSIMCEVRGKRSLPTARAQDKAPSLYFAHLGPEAKRKSIPVLESLRRADIAVRHALTYDQIADQMTTAKVLGVPFMLIMGHKEAMEDTVLVRDTRTNAQYAVPASDLPGYLRKRHIGTH